MEVFNHERAKQLIEERGLKRRWVAAQINLQHASLTQYLIGRSQPARDKIERLAALLGVNVAELLREARRQARTA